MFKNRFVGSCIIWGTVAAHIPRLGCMLLVKGEYGPSKSIYNYNFIQTGIKAN